MIDMQDRQRAPQAAQHDGTLRRLQPARTCRAALLVTLAALFGSSPASAQGTSTPPAEGRPAASPTLPAEEESTRRAGSTAETPSTADAGDDIFLQLNNLQPIQPSGCRLSFVATNEKSEPIDQLGVEVVVFDASNRIDQFLMLEFTRLPSGKTKAAQFDLAERSCDEISQLLVNDILNCGNDSASQPTCTETVRLDNLTDIELAF